MLKYSAIGPKASAGKNERAVRIRITAKVIIPNVHESVLSVPADSGIYFLLASIPIIATGTMMGKNRPNIKAIPVLMFQKILLSARPSKPLPLLAVEEVNSYNISLKP